MSDTDPTLAPQQKLFGAFLETPQRRRWPVLAVLLGVALTVGGLRLVAAETGVNIVTPRGVRTIEQGMTKHQVNQLLGLPFAAGDSPGGLDCFRYGYPNLDNPSFVVSTICYQEARLHDISQERYVAWTVSDNGTQMTAPPEQ